MNVRHPFSDDLPKTRLSSTLIWLLASPWRVISELAELVTARRLTWLMILVGVAFRGIDYAKNRTLWRDESDLLLNVEGSPFFEFGRPLLGDQLAPPGFLVIARLSSHMLGVSSYAIRFIPLVCGIGVLFVLRKLAERTVSEWAVPIVLGLAALSDDLIYYSGEFKPYSGDLLIAMALTLLFLDRRETPLTPGRLGPLFVVGVIVVWFSFSSVFVLAAGGLWLLWRSVSTRSWYEATRVGAMGLGWIASFLPCYLLSRRLLGDGQFMWMWWDFAFLPLPPRSLSDVQGLFWTIANVFTNPVGIVTPFGAIASGLLALGLFVVGVISLARRKRGDVPTLLLTPVGLLMLTSALHRYPFHGRLLLFLVPAFLLPLAEGVAVTGRRCGRVVLVFLVIVLLVCPLEDALNHVEYKRVRAFDTHGDQRNDLLDALEGRRKVPVGN